MRSDSVREYYEQYWSDQGHCPRGYVFDDLIQLLQPRARGGTSWLDVGCGDGRTAGTWLVEQGCGYVGVDISQAAVDEARSLGLDVSQIDDVGSLPFEDRSFDGAVCLEVLEHLFDPAGAAREIFRVLRPGGMLVVTVPNVAYWRRRAELALAGRWNPVGDDLSGTHPWRDPHIRFFTASALRRMLAEAGFGEIEVSGHAGAFVRDLPWIGMRLWRRRVSRLYRAGERSFPGLFGLRLNVTARKPVAESSA